MRERRARKERRFDDVYMDDAVGSDEEEKFQESTNESDDDYVDEPDNYISDYSPADIALMDVDISDLDNVSGKKLKKKKKKKNNGKVDNTDQHNRGDIEDRPDAAGQDAASDTGVVIAYDENGKPLPRSKYFSTANPKKVAYIAKMKERQIAVRSGQVKRNPHSSTLANAALFSPTLSKLKQKLKTNNTTTPST